MGLPSIDRIGYIPYEEVIGRQDIVLPSLEYPSIVVAYKAIAIH
jgi:hypothetical protein